MSIPPDSVRRAVGKLQGSYEIAAREVPISSIVTDDGRRIVSERAVTVLADSIRDIGLMSPIIVRPRVSGKEVTWALVAGRHRLEAFRRLNEADPYKGEDGQWTYIPAVVQYLDDIEARLAEIAENLHRAELTRMERSEQIAEWVRLTEEKRGQLAQVKGGRGIEGGISAAARELGVERTEVRRAEKIAGISDEAKEAAREAGLDDNQSALLKIARAHPASQADAVGEIAEARALKIEQDVQNRAAQEVAEIIVQYVPDDCLDGLKANIHASSKISTILAAINNLVGQSTMDRRFG